jgi:hypothetical protein
LNLFRGITVLSEEPSQVTENLAQNGIRGDEGTQWQAFKLNDLRPDIHRFLQKPDLSLTDTRPPETAAQYFPTVCACGDELGASYYAVRHNTHSASKETALVIHFSVESSRVYVDGRDFLYTCFQMWDRDGTGFLPVQRRSLISLFGKRIIQYFDKAASSRDQKYRIALCDLACQDLQAVRSHAKNRIIIGGRYGVVFSSAFFVKVPLLPTEIIKVDTARQFDFRPQLTLDDFLRGRLNLSA